MSRLHSLDYLRGLTAFGIMIYHYTSSLYGEYDSSTFLGRIGVYGVSIFYILSGLTLYHVYYDSMKPSRSDILVFAKKRILRIFPLLWVVTILSVLINRTKPDFVDLFLNLSGLFGFIRWDKYFSAGVWSIGNEIVFYTFFPLFVFFMKRFRFLVVLFFLFAFGFYLYFSFFQLNTDLTLSDQWRSYTNPFNQLFLFFSGFLIGVFFTRIQLKNIYLLFILIIAIILFSTFPVIGNTINIVTGINRLIFTLLSISICCCFYKLNYTLPPFFHRIFETTGLISYSIYLLHPIVWSIVSKLIVLVNFNDVYFSGKYIILTSVLITLIISYYSYNNFEKYFMRLSK